VGTTSKASFVALSSSFAIGEESESFGSRGDRQSCGSHRPVDKVGATVRHGDSVRVNVCWGCGVDAFSGGTVDT
jgi:hypothetical protein